MSDQEKLQEPKKPDGGWGWVVVGAVALINMSNQAILSVFGLLFLEHLNGMNQEISGAAFITNMNSLILNFSGVLVGPAIKGLSPRIVAFLGCILTSLGLMICAASTQFWHIILGYSVLVGIGLGLIAPSTFMAINSYFSAKRGRAVGMALAGAGLGQMFIPHLVRILLDNYGFRITTYTMGFLALQGLIGASLFRPLKTEEVKVVQKGQNIREVKLLLDLKNEKDKSVYQYEVKVIPEGKLNTNQSKTRKLCQKIFKTVIQALDLELLKDLTFWNIIIGLALVYTASINFSMLYPVFLMQSVGISRSDTATCMSILAGADIVCRLLLPFLTDKLKVPYRVTFLFGTIGLLAARAMIAESSSLVSLLLMSALYGGAKSATVINNNLSISAHCKPEKLPGGLGLGMISKAVIVITIGQLLGWFRDYSGSNSLCLHAQNGLLLVVIVFWSVAIISNYCKSKSKSDSTSIV